MKQFSGIKSLKTILKQCKDPGVPVDMSQFRTGGSDYVVFGNRANGYMLFNTFNGRFFGRTPDGVEFCSDDPKHDDKPWMQALLAFVYIEKR